MSKRTAILRRQDQLYNEIAMMHGNMLQHQGQGQHDGGVLSADDPMAGVQDDFGDGSLMQRATRYLLSPHQKMYQMPSPPHQQQQQQHHQQQQQHHQQQQQHQHHQVVQQQVVQVQQQPRSHRSRKNSQHQQQQQMLDQQHASAAYAAMKQPANMGMLMQDVFGQGPLGHLVMPAGNDMGVGQTMEVGGDGNPNEDVILVPNMLKSEVIESGEVVVRGGHDLLGHDLGGHDIAGHEIVIDEHRLGGDGDDDDEYGGGDSLVIDTTGGGGAVGVGLRGGGHTHGGASNTNDITGYDCGECGAVMKSRGSLKKHIAKYHAPAREPEELEEAGRVYQCQACAYQTQRRDKLDKHVGKHVAEGLSSTGKRRGGAGKGSLPQRMRHAAEEYKCGMCPYKCTVEKALRKHNKLHQTGNKQFVVKVSCYVCGKDRSTEADLRKHMKKHRDGKDFQCDICGFASVQLKKIIQHRRMHTGEKPHLCPHCTYRSSRRDNLRSHVRRMHKKENMYIDTFNPRAEQAAAAAAAAEMNAF